MAEVAIDHEIRQGAKLPQGMIAVTVQVITERGVQTSASGEPLWVWALTVLGFVIYLYFLISMLSGTGNPRKWGE